jgi:hypothetical protein
MILDILNIQTLDLEATIAANLVRILEVRK